MFYKRDISQEILPRAVGSAADGGLTNPRSTRQYLHSDERTPEAVAVVITKAEGGRGEIRPSTVLPGIDSAFESETNLSSPSLVSLSITQQFQRTEQKEHCKHGVWVRGMCELHGTIRWVQLPCKRRTCPVCGKTRLKKMAYRIGYGLDTLGGGNPGVWMVLTWSRDVEKVEAVRDVNKFIRWLKYGSKNYPGQLKLECAKTWEVTKRGRYHCNLILTPWSYIPQAILSARWKRFGGGMRLWVERVKNNIGVEVSKSRQSLPGYVAKWEQMVMTGRGVSYSKGWPKPPAYENQRKGNITWIPECGKWDRSAGSQDGSFTWYCVAEPLENELAEFLGELSLGYWHEVKPGEFALTFGNKCDCFDDTS